MLKKLTILLISIVLAISCVDDVGENWKTFEGELVYSYLKNRSEVFSEFVMIIDKAGLKGMLSAYGQYTCLAPTNEAMRKYYQSKGKEFTIDSLKQDDIVYLAKTHIVGGKYFVFDLEDGVLPNTNMNDRNIEIYFSMDSVKNTLKILLNDSSQIISKNNEVHNGIIHGIDRIIEPDTRHLPEMMLDNPDISIFAEALMLTGLDDSLRLVSDDKYKPSNRKVSPLQSPALPVRNPSRRKYGYTALVESNELLKANGINSLEDLISKAKEFYPSDIVFENDYKNRNNSLNQYISYHLIEKAIYFNTFFYRSNAIQGYTPDEFMETMLANRIIRASRKHNRIVLNTDTDHSVLLQETGSQTTINGVYHLLENILVYNDNVETMLKSTRIRFDIASILPELVNNRIRCNYEEKGFPFFGTTFIFDTGYFKYLTMTRDTYFYYAAGANSVTSFERAYTEPTLQADFFMVNGFYDINLRLLPVPPGTYEVRFGYRAGMTAVVQIYVDNKPIGIPVNLGPSGRYSEIGWLLDSKTEDNGIKNDQILHNKGYMKAPNTIVSKEVDDNFLNARDNSLALRKVVGTYSFTDYQPHFLRFKSVMNNSNNSLTIDYIELVPKSVYDPPGDDVYETRD